MKLKLFTISLIFCSVVLNAQRLMEKEFQVTRIPLKEKFNLAARDLPSLLIQAFCEGKITAYYPQKPSLECGYHEFAAHFEVLKTQPVAKGDVFEEVYCPNAFCSTKNEASVEPFRLYFDVIEDKEFSNQKSSEKFNIRYIRLIYAFDKHGMEVIKTGPLFVYEDVSKLNAQDYSLLNPKNDAARISFKKYFESRMFMGFPLSADNAQPKKTNPNKENDKWQN